MKPDDCRERASQCFDLADNARTDQSRSTFYNLGRHWLLLAEELDADQRSSAAQRPRPPSSGLDVEQRLSLQEQSVL
jgi:hypothetical protein